MIITIQSNDKNGTETKVAEIKEGSKVIINFPMHYDFLLRQTIICQFQQILAGTSDILVKPDDVTYEILTIQK